MLAALAPAEPKDGLTDPDDVPEPPDEAITKPGDLWLLGDHRLLCGDAGTEADLDRLLDGVTVDLLLTDPPYNVRVEPRSNNAIAAGMAASYDESYQAALGLIEPASAAPRRSMRRASITRGFDVARGKSGIRHHQKLDLERHPEKAQATHRKLRAKDRPLVNDFITDADFAARLAGLVRQRRRGSSARVAPSTSGAATPTSPTTHRPSRRRALLQPGDHLGQGAPGPHAQGLHGRPRVVLLRLAGGRRPPLLRARPTCPTCGRQEGQPERDGPPDREAGRAGTAGDRVQLAAGRGGARPLRGLGLHARRRRADRAAGLPRGDRPALLRTSWSSAAQAFTGKKAERVPARQAVA